MDQCFDRRSILALSAVRCPLSAVRCPLSAADALAAALPGCTSPPSAPSQQSYELTDYGYTASIPEAVPMERPRGLDKVGSAARTGDF
jgi:hypothetical protein